MVYVCNFSLKIKIHIFSQIRNLQQVVQAAGEVEVQADQAGLVYQISIFSDQIFDRKKFT